MDYVHIEHYIRIPASSDQDTIRLSMYTNFVHAGKLFGYISIDNPVLVTFTSYYKEDNAFSELSFIYFTTNTNLPVYIWLVKRNILLCMSFW